MGMDTIELDTRDEDFHRCNKTLREWEESQIENDRTEDEPLSTE